jgi:proline racemase/trans-L-3-hydroxyproline dehydratase
VRCEADVAGGRVRAVRMENVPSFVQARGLEVEALGRAVRVDVGYGGAFYGSLPAAALGLQVVPEHVQAFVQAGREIKRAIEAAALPVHPLEPELQGVYGVIFHDDLGGDAATLHQRNVTVFADGEVDRSPCGSGTSARLALLHAAGELAGGRRLRHDSIIGTTFRGWVPGTMAVDGREAVTTVIEGRAFRTGRHVFELDPDDEVGLGFALR